MAVPSVHNLVVDGRVRRRGIAGPGPALQIVEHRVTQVVGAHAGLAQQRHDVGAFGGGRGLVIRIRIRIDAERYAQSLAFADITQRILVEAVVPTVADADNRAFHAGILGGLPIDLPLPFRYVDHTLGLLHEQCAVGFKEGRGVIVRAPVGAIFIALQGNRAHGCSLTAGLPGFTGSLFRFLYGFLDFAHFHGDERFAVGFGQRIRLSVGRANQFLRRHRFAGFQILNLSFFGDSQIRRHHHCVIGQILAHLIRQFHRRIVRHRTDIIRRLIHENRIK